MRKVPASCLVIAVLVCLTNSAEAQLLRRLLSPVQQQFGNLRQQAFQQPQFQEPGFQRQQPQFQQQAFQQPGFWQPRQPIFAPEQQRPAQCNQAASLQGPTARNAAGQDLILVEVDSQGRILRQLMDSQQLGQAILSRRATAAASQFRQPQPTARSYTQQPVVASQPSPQSPVPVFSQNIVTQPTFVARPVQLSGRQVVGNSVPLRVVNPVVPTQFDIARQSVSALQFPSSPVSVSPALTSPVSPSVVSALPALTSPVSPSVVLTLPALTSPALTSPVSTLPALSGPEGGVTAVAPQTAQTATMVESALAEPAMIEPAVESPLGEVVDSNLVSDTNVVPAAASGDATGSVSILESTEEAGVSVLDSQDEASEPGSLFLNGPSGE